MEFPCTMTFGCNYSPFSHRCNRVENHFCTCDCVQLMAASSREQSLTPSLQPPPLNIPLSTSYGINWLTLYYFTSTIPKWLCIAVKAKVTDKVVQKSFLRGFSSVSTLENVLKKQVGWINSTLTNQSTHVTWSVWVWVCPRSIASGNLMQTSILFYLIFFIFQVTSQKFCGNFTWHFMEMH